MPARLKEVILLCEVEAKLYNQRQPNEVKLRAICNSLNIPQKEKFMTFA